MLLQDLKKKINKVKNISRITKSLKNISIIRVRSLQRKIHTISNHINIMKDFFFQNCFQNEHHNQYETIHIFIFSDMGFVGNFNKHHYIYLNTYPHKAYIIGNKGLDLSKKNDKNFEFLGKLYSNNSKTLSHLFTNKYINIDIHLQEKIYKINSLFFFKYSDENIHKNNCWMAYNIEKILLQVQLEDTKQRMQITMRALTNSEDLLEISQQQYNRMRQESITNDMIIKRQSKG